MLARGTLCRRAADAPPTRAHDLAQLARLVPRTHLVRNDLTLPAFHARRAYATAIKPTKPTATVKKAVKATAAATKPAPKKKAAPKKKVAAAPKAAVKKAAPAKKPKKRVIAKKAAPKKAVPRKRVKKLLTAEEQQRAKIRELRAQALKAPVSDRKVTAFNAYIAEQVAEKKTSASESTQTRLGDAARAFKGLTPAELEHYNHLANEKSAANRAELLAWVHSYTPDQIRTANNARAALRRIFKDSKRRVTGIFAATIDDDRRVKRAESAYVMFNTDRYRSGDFKGINVINASKLISAEWQALSAGEKKKYEDAAQADRERAAKEKLALSA